MRAVRTIAAVISLAVASSAVAQTTTPPVRSPWRAADGVTIDEVGDPQYSTFSLCAIDPATGQSGAAVTTRVPFVGRAVPWVRAGVGAVCTQASTMVEYGVRGLDLMAKGVEPKDAVAQLLADDAGRESRLLGMIDQCRNHVGQRLSTLRNQIRMRVEKIEILALPGHQTSEHDNPVKFLLQL